MMIWMIRIRSNCVVPGERRDDVERVYTTTLSRFAARVMPVYNHRARLS